MDKIHLSELDQLEEMLKRSQGEPVVVFKHSTRCPISARAWSSFQSDSELLPPSLPLYYLDVISHRSLSQELANRLGVEHQSPQVLLIQTKICVFDRSHSAIKASELNSYLN